MCVLVEYECKEQVNEGTLFRTSIEQVEIAGPDPRVESRTMCLLRITVKRLTYFRMLHLGVPKVAVKEFVWDFGPVPTSKETPH